VEPPQPVYRPLVLPDPIRFLPQPAHRIGDAPSFYRGNRPYLRPVFRVAPGFSGRIAGRPVAAFSLDLQASMMAGLHPGKVQWGLVPEVGYHLRAPGLTHLFTGGLGVVRGITAEVHNVVFAPRVVVGTHDGRLAWGARGGLIWGFAENGFAVELSYQLLFVHDRRAHDLLFSVSIDLAMLVTVLGKVRAKWL
jgi:hypothetical protein